MTLRPGRRRRGFEAGGSFSPELLGLSVARSRELALHRGWRRVVGPMSERIRVIDLRRGLLRLKIDPVTEDETRALCEMLPALCGRLAALCPRLGIRRYRVVGPEGKGEGPVKPVEFSDSIDSPGIDEPSARTAHVGARHESGDPATRLTRVMQRCLDRAQKP